MPSSYETLQLDLAELQEFLDRAGIEHFTAKEICWYRHWGMHEVPDRILWPNILEALRRADKLRKTMGFALICTRGWSSKKYNKAVGGARRSQHLQFRALDLRLPQKHNTKANRRKLYIETVRMHMEPHAREVKMGCGIYRKDGGPKVHIDAGYKYRYWLRLKYWAIRKAIRKGEK